MSAAPTQDEKARRDAVLAQMTQAVPYHREIGVEFTRMGDELTGRLNYEWKLIGNPAIPALHGGVVGAFLEIPAHTQLSWDIVWPQLEAGGETAEAILRESSPPRPRRST